MLSGHHHQHNQLKVVKFAQLNVNKSPAAMTSFANFCHSNNIDVMCITEPPIRRGLPNINRRLQPIYCQSNGPDGPLPVRACICVLNPRLQPIMFSHLSNSDCTTCKVASFIVASLYAEPGGDATSNWTTIASIAAHHGQHNLIITGDFNSDHQIWFSRGTSNRGADLLATFLQYGLSVINNCDTPTFDTIRGKRRLISHTDLTVASASASVLINNWCINDQVNFSDHRVITFNADINGQWSQPPRHTTVRWNTNNADWDGWADSLKYSLDWHHIDESFFDDINDAERLDFAIASLTTIIKTVSDQSFRKYNVYRRRRLPWHDDDELKQLANRQKQLYRRIRRHRRDHIPDHLTSEYHRLRTAYRGRLDTLKEEFLRQQMGDDTNQYEKVCRLLKHQISIPAQTLAGCDDPEVTVKKLLDDLFPDDFIDDDTTRQTEIRLSNENWLDERRGECLDFPDVTTRELFNIVTKIKNDKSPGFDNISPEICKKLLAFFPEMMTAIMNACIRTGHVPYLWKISTVRIIPKPGKTNYGQTSSFRPIGLLPILGKILESIMAGRIRRSLATNCPMSTNQYGFTSGKSTIHALDQLMCRIDHQQRDGNHVIMASIDIKGAFNHAWNPGIIDRLVAKKCPDYIVRIMANYMDDRRVVTTYGGTTLAKTTNRGTVQGSVMGPLLWNLIIDEFLHKDFGANIHVQAFADDIAAVIAHRDLNQLGILASKFMRMATDWCNSVKLHMSAEKSVIMYMSRKLRLPVLPTIMVDNRRIDYVEQTKILGVTIDRKRDFRPHLHLVIEKTTRIYRQILAMVHRNLGMRPHILKMIYRSVVVPTITYAAAIWKHAIVFKYMWNHLRQFVRPWAQLISGSYRTASFISTTAIADIAPLELEIMYEASVSLARIHGNYKFGDDFIDIDIPDCADNMVDLPPNIVANQLFACTYHHFITKIVRMRHSIGGCFAVYNGTYYIVTKYYRFPPYCSNLQADLFVILEAVKFAKEKFSSAAAITIINNNIGAIKHILKNDRKETINLARKIMMAMTNNNMTIHWQKVNPTDQIWHDVRKWARDAATSSLEFKFNLMPMSYVKKVERKRLLANWNKIYIEDKYGSNIKQLHPNVDDVRKFAPFVNKWLTMSLTGHGQFGKYLEKIGRRDDANCQCGLSEQSVHHLKFDCPLMNEPRYRFDMARRNCISPIELIKLEVVFYEQIAIRANELNNGIHQYHTPIT